MKPRFKPRELLITCLPFALLGGAAWWFMGRVEFGAGEPRLVPLQWERVALSPLDVAHGFAFAAKSRVHLQSEVPAEFGSLGTNCSVAPSSFQLRYRRGANWQVVPAGRELPLEFETEGDSATLRVRLRAVPGDAREVRASGVFVTTSTFQAPASWTASSPAFQRQSTGKRFRVWSVTARQPFDIALKQPDEPFPVPVVSRATNSKFIEARWFVSPQAGNRVLVRLRLWPVPEPGENLLVDKSEWFDGDGQPVSFYEDGGAGNESSLDEAHLQPRLLLGPRLPKDEGALSPLLPGVAPRGGWNSLKLPLSLHLRLSRNGAWPLDINAKLRPQQPDVSFYGAS